MWDETSSGMKRPRTKHPRDETEMVRKIQHPGFASLHFCQPNLHKI